MGYFFERVSRAFSFIWAAITMAFKDKDLLVPSLLSLVATLAYVGIIFGALYATGTLWLVGIEQSDVEAIEQLREEGVTSPADSIEEEIAEVEAEGQTAAAEEAAAFDEPSPVAPATPAMTDAEREAQDESRKYARWAFYIVATFGGYVITYLFTAMTISLVYDHLSGKDARIGEAIALVSKRVPGIVLLALVSTGVAIISMLARGKKGEETFLSGLIDKLWTVASFLILPAIVIEDFSVWKGLKRAKDIAAKNLLVVAVGEIAVSMVANLIAFLGIAGGLVSGFLIYRVMPQPLFIPISITGIIVVLVIAFTGYVKIAYYTCLYVNAMETANAGQRVEVTGPLASALA